MIGHILQQGHVPHESKIRDFVCQPPPANTRLYCTMIRRDDDSADADAAGSADAAAGRTDVGGAVEGVEPPPANHSASSHYGVAFTLYLEFLGGLIPLLKV